jgi:hypothetical protein
MIAADVHSCISIIKRTAVTNSRDNSVNPGCIIVVQVYYI